MGGNHLPRYSGDARPGGPLAEVRFGAAGNRRPCSASELAVILHRWAGSVQETTAAASFGCYFSLNDAEV
jgi:hypothetical protein